MPSPDELNPSFFTDPHFLAAAHTFQDHLCSGWMSDEHLEKVASVQRGIRDGTLHAPWKDAVWEQDHESAGVLRTSRGVAQRESSARAGSVFFFLYYDNARFDSSLRRDAAELKLVDLVKHHFLRVGDTIAYKRHFAHLNLIVEKDVIVGVQHFIGPDFSDTGAWAFLLLLSLGTLKNRSRRFTPRRML